MKNKALLLPNIAVFLFILGACIESSWLSVYLQELGFSGGATSSIFTCYGIGVALTAWLSGSLINRFGYRKVILASTLIFLTGTTLFILQQNFWGLMFAYFLRGAAYPLVAYSLLIHLTCKAPLEILGRVTAAYWISFNLGFSILGPVLSTTLLEKIDAIPLLLLGAVFAMMGGFLAYVSVEENQTKGKTSVLKEIKSSLALLQENHKLFNGVLIKAINNIAPYGFLVVMPIFLRQSGFTLQQWSFVWSMTYVVNIFASSFFGWLGDQWGWRKTLMYCAGPLTAASCVLIYLMPQLFPGSLPPLLLAFALYAFGIGAYCPLSALVPALEPDHKVLATACLNLGSGLSNLFGPLIVTIFYGKLGIGAIFVCYTLLYLASSLLAVTLKTGTDIAKNENSMQESL